MAKTISKKGARLKGHNFERRIAKKFRDEGIFPDAARQLEYQTGLGVDLTNTDEWDFQLKRTKKYAPLTKINEVPSVKGRKRCLIAKGDNQPTLVTVDLDVFIDMMKQIKSL